jgi:hypothetical protein
MKLTDSQSDHITEIMFNLDPPELDQAIAGLSAESLRPYATSRSIWLTG